MAASGKARGVFVTGTGTEVGKTVVAAVLARSAAAAGERVGVFKPAVSGLEDYRGTDELPDHELLRLASGSEQSDDEIAPYRFDPPLSPHLAAELAGVEIQADRLVRAASEAGLSRETVICEGVGGFLVPLTSEGYLVRDLAVALGYSVVVVGGPGLGTINHTLLTVEAVRAAGLEVASVVLTPWPAEPERIHVSNRESIARLGAVEVQVLDRIDVTEPDSWPKLATK